MSVIAAPSTTLPLSFAAGRTRDQDDGNRNAMKHGEFGAKTLVLKRQISALARMARETMAGIE
jgi:hypothetical protein